MMLMRRYRIIIRHSRTTFFLLMFALLPLSHLSAQTVSDGGLAEEKLSYHHGIGIRSGRELGLSYKHFLSARDAFELNMTHRQLELHEYEYDIREPTTPDEEIDANASEVTSYYQDRFRLRAQFQGHFGGSHPNRVRLVLGGGLHIDYLAGLRQEVTALSEWGYDEVDSPGVDIDKEQVLHVGLNMNLGLEYKPKAIPFSITFDLIPSYNVTSDRTIDVETALTLRYVF